MNTVLLIAALVIAALILMKIFLKTLKVFLLMAVIAAIFILWWLFQQGRLFH